jgi:hypothetical protein
MWVMLEKTLNDFVVVSTGRDGRDEAIDIFAIIDSRRLSSHFGRNRNEEIVPHAL